MLSFKSIAVFATLAFGAISAFAAPTLDHNEVEANTLVTRCGCTGVADIVAGVYADVQVHVQELTYLTASNCTVDTVTGIVADVKAIINTGILDVHALVGADVSIITAYAGVAGAATVDIVANLLGELLCAIFGAIAVVLKLNLGVSLNVILSLFCGLGEVLGAFVSAIISVSAGVWVGLAAAVYAHIGAVVSVILQLHITLIVSVLAIVV